MKSTELSATPGSLLATMRVGGMVLILASLSVLTAYLLFQRVWIEPMDRGFAAESALLSRLDDLRIALADERNARGLHETVPGAVDRAAGEADRAWTRVKAGVEAARAAGIDGTVVAGPFWGRLEAAIQTWRVKSHGSASSGRELAYAELRKTLDETKGELRRFDAAYTAVFDARIQARTWLLLLLSALGGIVTWGATTIAIRRTRHSLKRIAAHVEEIRQGVHAPRTLESFSEIAQVNERLNELGRTLERAQTEAKREGEAARERQRELELAHQLALDLSRGITEAEVAETFLRQAPTEVGAERAEVLRLVKSEGILEEVIPSGAAGDGGEGVKTAAPRAVADPASCAGFRSMSTVPSQGAAGSCAASPWPGRPVLCIPLLGAHGATGVVHFLARSPVGLAAMPRALAETLVRLFAPALDNARLLRESIERSATDPLTGLANRRRLEEYAPKAIALSQRQGAPLSVIVLDLDRFKQINDRFGHDEGDRALTVVAKALQANVRATDLAARLGGDEFALLLPGSSAGEAAQVMERIREALAAGADARPYTLGVSAGIAEISPRSSTLRELLAHADRALYDAKRGRPWTSGGPLTANA